MRPVGTPDELQRRRLRAVALLAQGYPPVEVARMVGADRRSVRRWKAVYRKKGRPALKARPASGRPPKLPAPQRRRLERELLRGAKAAGFATDLWTCPRVARLAEYAWGYLKMNPLANQPTFEIGQLAALAHRHARSLQRNEQLLRSFLRHSPPFLRHMQAITYTGINS